MLKNKIFLCCALVMLSWSGLVMAQMPQSSDRVSAQADFSQLDQGQGVVKIKLNIDQGWHVNAHPASIDFLIATDITAKADGQDLPISVDWPAGQDSGIELDKKEIKVYEDGVILPVSLDENARKQVRQADGVEFLVRVQSCSDEGLCLPPSTVHIDAGSM